MLEVIIIKNTLKLFKVLGINEKSFIIKHILYFMIIIVYSICSIIYPSFIHFIIDKGVTVGNTSVIIYNCFFMVIVGLLQVTSDYWIKLYYDRFNISFTMDMKNRLFHMLLNSKNSFSSQKKVGDLYTYLNSDLSSISTLFTCEIPNIIKNILTFIGVSFFVLAYFHGYGLIVIFFSLFSVLFQNKFGNKIMHLSEKMRDIVGDEASYSTEVLSNLEEIQMSGYWKTAYMNFEEKNNNVKYIAFKNNKFIFLSNSLGYLMNTLMILIILVIGVFEIQSGSLEVGMLFALTIYVQRLTNPIVALVSSYIDFKNTYPLICRIQSLLEKIKDEDNGKLIPQGGLKSITYKNLGFIYPNSEREIFKDFNFDILEGDIVGIIGHNGIGKSTLAKLIFKLCEPSSGEIIINSKEKLNDISINYLHDNVGYVGQNPFLFSGKMKDVINPSRECVCHEKILEIFHELNLDFNLFNNSIDFNLSENSSNISGGEKQKIALVRLILENKQWLILDEPTSSMDAESEKIVCRYLEKLCVDKTALIITHRPEILNICNKIIDLNKVCDLNKV